MGTLGTVQYSTMQYAMVGGEWYAGKQNGFSLRWRVIHREYDWNVFDTCP